MGYYGTNPYEAPEAPRCIECDDCMTERSVPFFPAAWICENPDCPDCPDYHRRECNDEHTADM